MWVGWMFALSAFFAGGYFLASRKKLQTAGLGCMCFCVLFTGNLGFAYLVVFVRALLQNLQGGV